MNALVTYESSSDEDESDSFVQQPQSKTQHDRTPHQNGLTQADVQEQDRGDDSTSAKGPLLGPTIPENVISTYAEYSEGVAIEDDDQMPNSERDILRHLTQATHPMNELPPSPPGSPVATTSTKFQRFLDLKAKGKHFNEDLAKKNVFQNPSLLSTMMSRAGIDMEAQYQTSLHRSVFDPTSFPSYAYKEELLKTQQSTHATEEAEKKLQSAAGKRTIDFVSAVPSASDTTSRSGLQHKRKKP